MFYTFQSSKVMVLWDLDWPAARIARVSRTAPSWTASPWIEQSAGPYPRWAVWKPWPKAACGFGLPVQPRLEAQLRTPWCLFNYSTTLITHIIHNKKKIKTTSPVNNNTQHEHPAKKKINQNPRAIYLLTEQHHVTSWVSSRQAVAVAAAAAAANVVTCTRRDCYPNTESQRTACMVHRSRPRRDPCRAVFCFAPSSAPCVDRWRPLLASFRLGPSRLLSGCKCMVVLLSVVEGYSRTNAGAQVKGRYIYILF